MGSKMVQIEILSPIRVLYTIGLSHTVLAQCTPLTDRHRSHKTRSSVSPKSLVFHIRKCVADIVFLKTWIPVDIPQFYNPVTSLLLPIGSKETWHGMKTVGELKRERGIRNTVNSDHLYQVGGDFVDFLDIELLPVYDNIIYYNNICHII